MASSDLPCFSSGGQAAEIVGPRLLRYDAAAESVIVEGLRLGGTGKYGAIKESN